MADKIRWGILSTGNISHKFATGLSVLADAELIAVGSRTQESADKFGDEFNIPHRHAGYEDLVADPEVDVIVSSGGVSMGDYDVTKLVLRDEVGVDFMQVAQKPGKPFGFGTIAGVPFFGLPGNPVSVMISFENFVRPALLAMQGANSLFRPRLQGIADEDLHSDPAKTVFVRVNVVEKGGVWHATYSGGQASNVLSGAANADALAILPRGVEMVRSGEPVTLALLRSLEARGEIYDG